MKNFPPRARPVVAPGCATELCAANAKARAIDCSSTEIKFRCDKKDRRSDGRESGRHRVNDKPRSSQTAGKWPDTNLPTMLRAPELRPRPRLLACCRAAWVLW